MTVKDAAAVPPKVTAVAPVKLVPVMVTTVPDAPLVGVNEVMVGAGMKVKVPLLVAVPPGVVTVIGPVAPLPTVALMVVALVDGEGCRRRAAEGHRGRPGEVGAGDGHHRPRAPAGRGERGDGRRRDEGEGAGAGGRAAGRGDGDRARWRRCPPSR